MIRTMTLSLALTLGLALSSYAGKVTVNVTAPRTATVTVTAPKHAVVRINGAKTTAPSAASKSTAPRTTTAPQLSYRVWALKPGRRTWEIATTRSTLAEAQREAAKLKSIGAHVRIDQADLRKDLPKGEINVRPAPANASVIGTWAAFDWVNGKSGLPEIYDIQITKVSGKILYYNVGDGNRMGSYDAATRTVTYERKGRTVTARLGLNKAGKLALLGTSKKFADAMSLSDYEATRKVTPADVLPR